MQHKDERTKKTTDHKHPENLATPSNDQLRFGFKSIHDQLIRSIRASSIIDRLFRDDVLSEDHNHELLKRNGDPVAQCRELMSTLHRSQHPMAFVRLRDALTEEKAYLWLVEAVDKCAMEFLKQSHTTLSSSDAERRRAAFSSRGPGRSTTLTKRDMATSMSPTPGKTNGSNNAPLVLETMKLLSISSLKQTDVSTGKPTSSCSGSMMLTASRKRPLWGVARFNNWITVVSSWSSVINVFVASSPFRRLPDITVTGLQDPTDIVTCCRTGRLYVADSGGDCLWRIMPSDRGDGEDSPSTFVFDRLTIADASPLTLSSADSGRLIVTPSTMNGRNKLFIYDEINDQTKQLTLLDSMQPLHAAETRRGTLIVCHIDAEPNATGRHGICEIDMTDGRRVLRSFVQTVSVPPSSTSCSPVYVVINPRDESRIFVADASSDRIDVIDLERFSAAAAAAAKREYDDGPVDEFGSNQVRRFSYVAAETDADQIYFVNDTTITVYRVGR